MELTAEQSFWNKVDRSGACWEWLGRKYWDGYGEHKFSTAGRCVRVAAHRAAWMFFHGREVGKGLVICHTCDNRSCVNPSHLFEGTQQDNVDDMIAKGRYVKGNPNPRRIVSEDNVQKIRAMAALGITYTLISKTLGIKYSTAIKVAKGYTWADAPGPISKTGDRTPGRPRAPSREDGRMMCSKCKTPKEKSKFSPSIVRRGNGWCRVCYSIWESNRRTDEP